MDTITATYTGASEEKQFASTIAKNETSGWDLTAAISAIQKDINGYLTEQLAKAAGSAQAKDDDDPEDGNEDEAEDDDQATCTVSDTEKSCSKKQKTS